MKTSIDKHFERFEQHLFGLGGDMATCGTRRTKDHLNALREGKCKMNRMERRILAAQARKKK